MAVIPDKDTIYIDIDDEITAIIDKVRASPSKIVALVLPKRASVLQSIVNMKLLKRSADGSKKNLVLVTSEAGLLPLAGTVGLYVAKTPQSKPEIPSIDAVDDDVITDGDLDDDSAEEITTANAGARSVGELAAAGALAGKPKAAAAAAAGAEGIETLSMDDAVDDTASDTVDSKAKAGDKPKKNRKLLVPNFDKFRLRLVFGFLVLVLLGVFFYLATAVLPKGTVTITTDTSDVNSSLTLTIDTAAKTLNAAKFTVPATNQKLDKTGSQQATATGKKNNGQKASGTITVTNCSGDDVTLAAGKGFSSGGHTFISQSTVTIPDSNYSSPITGSKCKSDGKGDVAVTAQQGGSDYNLAASSYTIANSPSASLTAQGTAMTGGTDDVIQILQQSDIDGATQKIVAQNSDAIKQQLQDQLDQNGLFALPATFKAGDPATTTSAKAGDQVANVTVTETTSYNMFGVKEADLKTLVDNDVKDKIDASKQSILSEGLKDATFKLNSATATTASLGLSTTATAGPDLKADTIKTQVAGKKSGEIKSLLKSDPGVTAVDVKFSPFWVNKAPSKAEKLTVTFVKSNGK